MLALTTNCRLPTVMGFAMLAETRPAIFQGHVNPAMELRRPAEEGFIKDRGSPSVAPYRTMARRDVVQPNAGPIRCPEFTMLPNNVECLSTCKRSSASDARLSHTNLAQVLSYRCGNHPDLRRHPESARLYGRLRRTLVRIRPTRTALTFCCAIRRGPGMGRGNREAIHDNIPARTRAGHPAPSRERAASHG